MRSWDSTPSFLILQSVVDLQMFGKFVSLGKLAVTILTGIVEPSHMALSVVTQTSLGGVGLTAGQTFPAI